MGKDICFFFCSSAIISQPVGYLDQCLVGTLTVLNSFPFVEEQYYISDVALREFSVGSQTCSEPGLNRDKELSSHAQRGSDLIQSQEIQLQKFN